MTTLKPCPFCGHENVSGEIDWTTKFVFVECKFCNARGPSDAQVGRALDAWNTRAEASTAESEE